MDQPEEIIEEYMNDEFESFDQSVPKESMSY